MNRNVGTVSHALLQVLIHVHVAESALTPALLVGVICEGAL